MKIHLTQNAPDAGDDPENRWDCDDCMDAPEAHEFILLILDDRGEVEHKFCIPCSLSKLTGVVNDG